MEIKKTIPQTVDECTKSGYVVDRLVNWAESLKKRGKIFAIILAVVGVLSSLMVAIEVGSYDLTVGAAAFTESIIMWLIGIVLLVFTYNSVALLLEALASIVYNTSVSANVALYSAASKKTTTEAIDSKAEGSQPSSFVPNEVWLCSNCGRQNVNRGNCWNCGQNK